MDTILPGNAELQRRAVEELLASHPLVPGLTGHRVRFDHTWDGEPGVWIDLYQPQDSRGSDDYIKQMMRLTTDLTEELRTIVPDREGFVHFIKPPS